MAKQVPFPEAAREYLAAFDAHRDSPSAVTKLRREVALDDLLGHPSWSPPQVRERLTRKQRRDQWDVDALARMAQRAQGGSV